MNALLMKVQQLAAPVLCNQKGQLGILLLHYIFPSGCLLVAIIQRKAKREAAK